MIQAAGGGGTLAALQAIGRKVKQKWKELRLWWERTGKEEERSVITAKIVTLSWIYVGSLLFKWHQQVEELS